MAQKLDCVIERDVLAHCLAQRQTRLQQCCRSLAAVPASATLRGNTVLPVDF